MIPHNLIPTNIEIILDKERFPWRHMKIGSHGPNQCYNKFKQIVDGQNAYEKMIFNSIPAKIRRKIERFSSYCICNSKDSFDSHMIGMIISQNAVVLTAEEIIGIILSA